MEYLLQHGADVHAKDDGEYFVILKIFVTMIKFLPGYFSLCFIVECLCVWYMCIIVLKVENSCYILKNYQ